MAATLGPNLAGPRGRFSITQGPGTLSAFGRPGDWRAPGRRYDLAAPDRKTHQTLYIVDDPLLALIARFIGTEADPDPAGEAFLPRQIAAIQAYVSGFPEQERDARDLEWVKDHARQYRQQWQIHVVSEQLAATRCPDCPLVGDRDPAQCEIHELWSDLLQRYVNHEISSTEYVESTLDLLAQHKSRLRVSRHDAPAQVAAT